LSSSCGPFEGSGLFFSRARTLRNGFGDGTNPTFCDGRNVYRREELLFEVLGRGRPLEQPLDCFVTALGFVGLAVAIVLVPGPVHQLPVEALILVTFALLFAGPTWAFSWLLRRRWR